MSTYAISFVSLERCNQIFTDGISDKCRGVLQQLALLIVTIVILYTWWRHQMETFSALLALCAGNSPVPSEFPAQRPVTRSVDVFYDLHLSKRLSKQSWGWWLETPWRPLWRQCNEHGAFGIRCVDQWLIPTMNKIVMKWTLLNHDRGNGKIFMSPWAKLVKIVTHLFHGEDEVGID